MAFCNGDPAGGGTEIARETVGGRLDGGATARVETLWTIHEPGRARTLYAVIDPDGAVAEFSTANNDQMLGIGGTDLVATFYSASAETDGSARIIVQVVNAGAPGATTTTLTLRRTGGALAATAQIHALEPGRLAQVALDPPPGTLPDGETFFTVVADEADGLA